VSYNRSQGGLEMTQPKLAQEPAYPVHEEFGKYPLYKVVSVFEDSENVDAAIEELNEHGFTIDEIEAYCGIEGGDRRIE
jgi:hypothetical protein